MKAATREKAEKGIYEAYLISVIAKGAFSILEIALGILLLFTNSIVEIVLQLINDEIIEDPSDLLSNWVQPLLHPSQEAQLFGGLYLLSHGVVKLFLVVGLLRKQLWAYPASIAVFTLFIIYQLFRYFAKTHSVWLLLITIVDIAVIWLIYHEYRRALKEGTGQAAVS